MSERVRRTLAHSNAVLFGTRHSGVSRFSGVRYALPPVGARRFAPPAPWAPAGEIDATRPGPLAPQHPSLLSGALGSFEAPQSEDCLHLTVWTPDEEASANVNRPVLVWLHGGALQSGGGALDWYDGTSLALTGDVVVVAVNYRLGVLGWLCPSDGVGNLGLLDQELALQWVAEHIACLGGDPNRVTVMGQSAGALCVVGMLARRPLFHRIILQSAPLGRGVRARAIADILGDAVLSAAGASDLDAARSLPLERLMQAHKDPGVRAALDKAQDGQGLFSLVADGATLPLTIDLDALAGSADVLIGTNRNEMAAFPGQKIGPDADRLGDAVFVGPAHRWATAAASAGRKSWRYRFDVAPNDRFGACHCIELPFVFGTCRAFGTAPMLEGLRTEDAQRLTQEVQRAWLAFVRDDAPPWRSTPSLHRFE